jgi:hypothetical protein
MSSAMMKMILGLCVAAIWRSAWKRDAAWGIEWLKIGRWRRWEQVAVTVLTMGQIEDGL